VTLVSELPKDLSGFAAILNIGWTVREHLPWTAVNSNGWIARVSSGPDPLPTDMGQPNPIAALMAASLGISEVFKRVYELPAVTAPLLNRVEFSLFDFSQTPMGAGPNLPDSPSLPDTVLVGAGAIGNGLVLLLSQMNCRGRLHVVDLDKFADGNLGTCVLLDDVSWLGEAKAELLSQWLSRNSKLHVTHDHTGVAIARSSNAVTAMRVDLVLNGLDDVEARHDAQMMWPRVLVDGGINAIGAAAVTYRLDRQGAACLRCMFELPSLDATRTQMETSGLSQRALADLSQPLSEEDIAEADEARRPWLCEMRAKGKNRCAVVSEAVSKRLGLGLADRFEPSAPFVATAAASLVLAQAVKSLFVPESAYVHRFQIESLFMGPDSSTSTLRPANESCVCVVNRKTIDGIAAKRGF
jgi:molybdopterin/thiamine biosynthesis adenylyltransferase